MCAWPGQIDARPWVVCSMQDAAHTLQDAAALGIVVVVALLNPGAGRNRTLFSLV